ncbi:stage II sporulation protein P [Zhaonella formicivorans]|uniref:stage II sporulation protein P n=1 Tax=Zhaonella formicivorans TaxID=2528593 RepID=UPI001D100C65|nr:stage II sporulation protein P [Zhaonella formicivorans]
MSKRWILSLALVMFAIGCGLLTQTVNNTYLFPAEDLAVINLPGIGVWENERVDGGFFTIVDEQGKVLDKMSRVVYVGDELIAEDNKQYRVDKVVGDRAIARLVVENALAGYEDFAKQVFSKKSVPTQTGKNLVALYHTHSAESYVPTDGTDSLPGRGGIFKVGDNVASGLENRGIEAMHSKRPHEPRDSNAYRRSRRTALELLKAGPAAIIDVHRDGIPDPDFYQAEVAGNNVTKIRLVVGRQNQNMQANLDFAKRVKAGVNEVYPGLVKSIFLAKGNYNQDLSPRSMLIEVGTHTNDRHRAEIGAKLFADALPAVLGIVSPTAPAQPGPAAPGRTTPATRGDWSALWLVLGVALIGGAAFLLVSTGSLQGAVDKVKQFTSSEWANFMGKLPAKGNTKSQSKNGDEIDNEDRNKERARWQKD